VSFTSALQSSYHHQSISQNFHDFLSTLPPNARSPHDLALSQAISPLDNIDPSKTTYALHQNQMPAMDQIHWLPMDPTHSDPSSTYSGSPTPSDEVPLPVHAPQPQHANPAFEVWKDPNPASSGFQLSEAELSLGLDLDFSQATQSSCNGDLQNYATGLEGLFDPSYSMNQVDMNGHDMTSSLGFELHDMVHESY
jgi:hypothetical protein